MPNPILSSCAQRLVSRAVCSVGTLSKPSLMSRSSQFLGRQISYPSAINSQRNFTSSSDTLAQCVFNYAKHLSLKDPLTFTERFSVIPLDMEKKLLLLSDGLQMWINRNSVRIGKDAEIIKRLMQLTEGREDAHEVFISCYLPTNKERVRTLIEEHSFSFSTPFWLMLLESFIDSDCPMKDTMTIFKAMDRHFTHFTVKDISRISGTFHQLIQALVRSNPTVDQIKPVYEMYQNLCERKTLEEIARSMLRSFDYAFERNDFNAEPFLLAGSILSNEHYKDLLITIAKHAPDLVMKKADWSKLSKSDAKYIIQICSYVHETRTAQPV